MSTENLSGVEPPTRTPRPQPARVTARSRLAALPPLSALLVSIVAHTSAAAVILTLALPADLPVPEPVAITVEIVAEAVAEKEEMQEVRKGDPQAEAPEEAAPEKTVPEPPLETAQAPPPLETEERPLTVPVPMRRPKPEKRKEEEPARDRTKLAKAKGLQDDPKPDIPLGEDIRRADAANATLAQMAVRGVPRNMAAEEKWLSRLAAHLERRKKYPSAAESRRKEGLVRVRFTVGVDGEILTPELIGSSGVAELDEAALDLLRRASPAPKPPPDVNTAVTVPISYAIRR